MDGLGRTIKVTEMDGNKQLTQDTIYGYDLNDNLTLVDQGGQTRTFKYDSLSRMTFERTPEQDATINDGSGTLWSAKHTYTSFDAVLTREDARGVVTTYGYDGLNRLSSVSYNTTGTDEQVQERDLVSKWRFTNYERDDETGSHYAVNRQYLTNVGRFTRPDPIAGSIGDPQTLNRYSYTRNDPINFVDPDGPLLSWCPPQYQSCTTVTGYLSGLGYVEVEVGFDGSGYGTFMWDQSSLSVKQRSWLNDFGVKLPHGFWIIQREIAERKDNLFDIGPDLAGKARKQVDKKIQRDIDDCVKAGGDAIGGTDESATRFATFVRRRVASKIVIEYLKVGVRQRIATGTISVGSRAGRLVKWGATRAMFGPLFVASTFLQMSYAMAPTDEELESMRMYHGVREQCREAVYRRYGLK